MHDLTHACQAVCMLVHSHTDFALVLQANYTRMEELVADLKAKVDKIKLGMCCIGVSSVRLADLCPYSTS